MSQAQIFPIVAGVLLFAFIYFFNNRPRHRFPPGPRALPIIGNALDIPNGHAWLGYQAMSRKYGSDIIHLKLFSTHLFVLNSTKVAKDIFEKRSTIYSDREETVMLHDLTGWGKNWAFMPYGELWRTHRRLFHQYFRPQVVPAYHPKIAVHVHRMLVSLLDSPGGFLQHSRHLAGSTIFDIVYGIDVHPDNDSYFGVIEKAVGVLSIVGNSGIYLVDSIPILKHLPAWFPGAKFKRDAAKWRKLVDEMYFRPYYEVKDAVKAGKAVPCLAATLLSEADKDTNDETLEKVRINITGTAYVGGSDTTVSSLSSFFLFMLQHPEVQRTAQEHLDRVVGRDRLPEMADRDLLPYIVGIVNEIFRLRPVLPLAPTHKCTTDDEYEGYFIPAGSLVIGNSWAILRDPNRYPDPDVFKPARFLTPEGKLDKSVPEPVETFGYSRRICPGRYFAADILFYAIANILAVFSIEKAHDDAGNVLEPSGEFSPGLFSFALPFQAQFKLRFPGAEELIRSSVLID